MKGKNNIPKNKLNNKSDTSGTIKKTKEALIQNFILGNNVLRACSAVNLARDTYYRWYKGDEKFAKEVDIAKDSRIQLVEDSLYADCMQPGNTVAKIFFLCNRAKDKWQNVNKVEHGLDKSDFNEIFDRIKGLLK